MIVLGAVLLLIPNIALTAERGSSCTTPNGIEAVCKPLDDCLIIRDAISNDKCICGNVLQFAKKSQCGYDTQPLVCCGDDFDFTSINSFFDEETQNLTTDDRIFFGNILTLPPFKENTLVSKIPSNILPDKDVCGMQIEHNRIRGGEKTDISEFPWMALLRYKTASDIDVGFRCGGTLINNRYVLTAAHCLKNDDYILTLVRLGEWQISSEMDCVSDEANQYCAAPVVDVLVEYIHTHPFYNIKTGDNDIALLKLERDVEFTENIRPICLPPSDLPIPAPGVLMTVCGWGVTESGTQADIKRKVRVPVLSNQDCTQKVTKSRVSPNQVCAGQQGKDSAEGDSGGPLMRTYGDFSSPRKQWYQEGIVSRGTAGLGIYTRVTRYIVWIKNSLND